MKNNFIKILLTILYPFWFLLAKTLVGFCIMLTTIVMIPVTEIALTTSFVGSLFKITVNVPSICAVI